MSTIRASENQKYESRSVSRLRDQLEQSRQNLMSRQKSVATNNRSNSSSHAIVNALGGGALNKYQKDLNKFDNNTSTKCTYPDCVRPAHKQNQCKHHFCMKVKITLRKQLRNIFRGPDKAYSSMDFYGRGYITEEDFLNSIVLSRIPFSKDDVREFFRQFNLFNNHNGGSSSNMQDSNNKVQQNVHGMNFDQFKKMFFPQLFLVDDDQNSDDDRKQKKNQIDLSNAEQKHQKDKQQQQSLQQSHNKEQVGLQQKQNQQPGAESIITDRLKKLEKILKDKFQNQWESVRKAFLALDSDYDGFITVEDILRYFGQEKDLNYNDLKKLIKDKDSKKIGKIGYTDFSKWVGNSIHQSEGFYFRHDSIKNPQFEANNEKNEMNKNNLSKKKAQECLINQNLEKTVLDKIQFQWKTLRKAFMDLNMEKSGSIMPEELRFYFKHWGLSLTDEQFRYLFEKFDLDGDGKISYKDFQLTVGSEIHPAEGLYFRQDKPQTNKINSCKHDKCWQATYGSLQYCSLHLKLHQDECSTIFGRFFAQLKTKWPKFIEHLRSKADQEDKNHIFFDDFMGILKKFKIELTNKEQVMIKDAFPGRDEGDKKRLNISRLYDHKYTMMLQKIYQKVDVHENDGDDDPVDQSGYTGQFYRQKKNLIPITESELVQVIAKNNKLVEIIRTIKEIDKQHNGFVTTTELDDILKIQYKEELGDRDLRQIMKKYASIQNRVLVDYKKFRDSIVQQIKLVNSNFTFPTESNTREGSIMNSPDKHQQSQHHNTSITATKPQKQQHHQSLKHNLSSLLPTQRAKSLDKPLFSTIQRYESSRNDISSHKKHQNQTYQNEYQHNQSTTDIIDSNVRQQLESINQLNDRKGVDTSEGMVMIKELINSRPQTRQYIKYSSTRGEIIPKKQYLKSDILNQTMNVNKNNGSLLSSNDMYDSTSLKFQNISKTPGQGASRLKLKQLSQTIDNRNNIKSMFQEQINDYSDFHIKNDSLIDNKLIQDNLKRAQSSHGIFGRNINSGSISIQAKNNSQLLTQNPSKSFTGINNLLQNLRHQRRNIQGATSTNSQSNNYSALDNYLSKAINNYKSTNGLINNSEAVLAYSKPTMATTTMNIHNNNNTTTNDTFNHSFDQSNMPKDKINVNYTSFASKKQSEAYNTLSQTMYQTLNNSSFSQNQNPTHKFKNVLKSKLSYEWKNIYRLLSQYDKSLNGQISYQDFESALDQQHVFMTKEELKRVQQMYGVNNNQGTNNSQTHLNYQQLSIDLGLHNNQLNFLKNSSVRMQNIQKLRNIYTSSDKKSRIDDLSSVAGISTNNLKGNINGGRNLNNTIIDRINTAAIGGRSHLAMRLNTQSSLSGNTHPKNLDNIKIQNSTSNSNNNNTITIQNQSQEQQQQQQSSQQLQPMSKIEVRDILLKKIKDFRDLIQIYQKKYNNEDGIIPQGDFKQILKQLGINNIPNNVLQTFIVNQTDSDDNQGINSRSKSVAGLYNTNTGMVSNGIDAREFLKFYL